MVVTTPYDPETPEFTRDLFLKCVLGAIDPFYDNSLERPSVSAKVAPKPLMPLDTPSAEFGYQASARSMHVSAHASISPYESPRSALKSPPPLHPQSQLFSPEPAHFTN
jgi:hypothetical protein